MLIGWMFQFFLGVCYNVEIHATIHAHMIQGSMRCQEVEQKQDLFLYANTLKEPIGIQDQNRSWLYPEGFSSAQTIIQKRDNNVLFFETKIPIRTGVLGTIDNSTTLLRGWHPILSQNPVTYHYDITVDANTAGFIGTQPFGRTSVRTLQGIFRGMYLPIVMAKEVRVRLEENHVLIRSDVTAQSHVPKEALSNRTHDFDRLILETLRQGEQALHSWQLPSPPMLISVVKTREHMAEVFDAGLVVSDRAFACLRTQPIITMHRVSLWQAQFEYTARQLAPFCSGSMPMESMQKMMSYWLLERFLREHNMHVVSTSDLLEKYAFTPEVDALIFAPQVPFVDTYYHANPSSEKQRIDAYIKSIGIQGLNQVFETCIKEHQDFDKVLQGYSSTHETFTLPDFNQVEKKISPNRWRFLVNELNGLYSATDKEFSGNVDFIIRQVSRPYQWMRVGAAMQPTSIFTTLSYGRGFGPKLTPLRFAHQINTTLTLQRLRDRLSKSNEGYAATWGVSYLHDSRLMLTTAFEGRGVSGYVSGSVAELIDQKPQAYVKAGASALKLWPLFGGKQAFVARLRGDVMFGHAPKQEQFLLGGRYTGGRGYVANDATGTMRGIASVEYRHVLAGAAANDVYGIFTLTGLEGAFFADVIALKSASSACTQNFFSDVGYGIRMLADVLTLSPAVLSMDVGVPLNTACQKSNSRLPFTFYIAFAQSFLIF